VKLCKKIGCEPYICTNAGSGTQEDMSDWVEYCNLKDQGFWAKNRISNGYKEPHGIKYWSIGNENYGAWEIGAWTSSQWGLLVKEAAKMILKVDSTIQLSAAALTDPSWNYNLLKEAGQYLRWISVHGYWAGSNDSYEHIMTLTEDAISDRIDQSRATLVSMGLEKKIKISFDEWNLRFWYHPRSLESFYTDEPLTEDDIITPRNLNDKNSIYTMSDAIFSACFLNTCLKNCDIIGMACFSPVVNTRGAIFTHKDGIVLRPTYYVFDLFSNYLKSTVLNSWRIDSEKISFEDRGKVSEINAIDAVATYKDGEFAISAVNRDKDYSHILELDMTDTPVKEMRIHTLNGDSADSYNDIDRTEVSVKTTEWKPFEPVIKLEAHSVNVIEIR
ncbi:MAG: alpha-N-arabinofuranosidase, partial [Clostridia bacterium]|nr:alpha-N-arabinofuranosidase [Clostridia bacterium]